MDPTLIRAADLSETPWRNGAGRKADIATGPGWLLGFAWLDRDAPFSDYAGHDRTITLLHGAGFRLALPAGAELTVDKPFDPVAFEGAGPIACTLPAGPCEVMNVITAYPALSHTVQVMDAADLAHVTPGPRVFLVVLTGTLGAAQPRDTIVFSAPARLAPAAGTRVAVVRIEPGDAGEEDEG
ncbi:MAG: HutD family protein [Rhodospirillales bacterium]|nr:HutD family protein [Rhodospirillales bacterium]